MPRKIKVKNGTDGVSDELERNSRLLFSCITVEFYEWYFLIVFYFYVQCSEALYKQEGNLFIIGTGRSALRSNLICCAILYLHISSEPISLGFIGFDCYDCF